MIFTAQPAQRFFIRPEVWLVGPDLNMMKTYEALWGLEPASESASENQRTSNTAEEPA
jgi:hypothetical protein